MAVSKVTSDQPQWFCRFSFFEQSETQADEAKLPSESVVLLIQLQMEDRSELWTETVQRLLKKISDHPSKAPVPRALCPALALLAQALFNDLKDGTCPGAEVNWSWSLLKAAADLKQCCMVLSQPAEQLIDSIQAGPLGLRIKVWMWPLLHGFTPLWHQIWFPAKVIRGSMEFGSLKALSRGRNATLTLEISATGSSFSEVFPSSLCCCAQRLVAEIKLAYHDLGMSWLLFLLTSNSCCQVTWCPCILPGNRVLFWCKKHSASDILH